MLISLQEPETIFFTSIVSKASSGKRLDFIEVRSLLKTRNFRVAAQVPYQCIVLKTYLNRISFMIFTVIYQHIHVFLTNACDCVI